MNNKQAQATILTPKHELMNNEGTRRQRFQNFLEIQE